VTGPRPPPTLPLPFFTSGAHSGALDALRARARGEAKPIPLPWPRLAEALGGGLWPGLHVLCAATGIGKTAAALQIAFSALRAGAPTLYVGLELGAVDITARAITIAENNGSQWSELTTAGPNALARLAPRARRTARARAAPAPLRLRGAQRMGDSIGSTRCCARCENDTPRARCPRSS